MHWSDGGLFEALKQGYGDGQGACSHPAVRWWVSFCSRLKLAAIRILDPNSPLAERLGEEVIAMRFAWWLVDQVGIAVNSASQYVSTVQGWHSRWYGVKLGGNLEFQRLPQLFTGLGFTHPNAGRPKLERHGVRPDWLRRGIDLCLGGDSSDQTPLEANLAAMLEVCFAGLLRSCEVALNTKKTTRHKGVFDPEVHSTRADCTHSLRNDETGIEYATYYARNSKSRDKATRHDKLKRILPSGDYIDASRALLRLSERDPVMPAERATTPAFRNPLTGLAITTDQFLQVLRHILGQLGLNPMHFGTHSIRIGSATALFVRGGDEIVIKTMGVWSSDAFLKYIRSNLVRVLQLGAKGCSADVTDDDHEAGGFIFDEDQIEE